MQNVVYEDTNPAIVYEPPPTVPTVDWPFAAGCASL